MANVAYPEEIDKNKRKQNERDELGERLEETAAALPTNCLSIFGWKNGTTVGQNKVVLRRVIIHFPTSLRVSD